MLDKLAARFFLPPSLNSQRSDIPYDRNQPD